MSKQWLPSGSDQEDLLRPTTDELERALIVRDKEIAALKANVAKLTQDATRWQTFKRLNNGGSWDMREFIFDVNGKNGQWVWIDRYDMDQRMDHAAQHLQAREANHGAQANLELSKALAKVQP